MEDFVTMEEFPDYEINKLGKVRNKQGRVLKSYFANNRQLIRLCKNGNHTSCRMHLLLAKSFVPKLTGFEDTVIHIDGNTKNNDISNLQWINRAPIGKFGVAEYISDTEKRWICGFCDGDGSLLLGISKNKDGSFRLTPEIMFAQSQNDGIPVVLLKIQELYGGCLKKIKPKYNWQRFMHRLCIKRKENVIGILNILIQFSALKYNQAEYLKCILNVESSFPTFKVANEKINILKCMHHSYNQVKIDESRLTQEYIGGLFDAEGCIYLSKKGKFTVSITQKGSPVLLQKIAQQYNGKLRLRQDEVEWWYKNAKSILEILKSNCFGKLNQVKEGLKVVETLCDPKETGLSKKRKMEDREVLYDNLKRQKKK